MQTAEHIVHQSQQVVQGEIKVVLGSKDLVQVRLFVVHHHKQVGLPFYLCGQLGSNLLFQLLKHLLNLQIRRQNQI